MFKKIKARRLKHRQEQNRKAFLAELALYEQWFDEMSGISDLCKGPSIDEE